MNIKRLNNHLFNLPRLRFSVVFSTVHEILTIVVPQNDVNIIQAGRYPRPSGDTSLTTHSNLTHLDLGDLISGKSVITTVTLFTVTFILVPLREC